MSFTIPTLESSPTFDAQTCSDETDMAAISAMGQQTGVISGLALSTDTDLTVSYAEGWVAFAGASYFVESGTVTASAASSTDRRDAVIYRVGTGVMILEGTPNPSGGAGWTRSNTTVLPPVKPTLTLTTDILLHELYLEGTGATPTTSFADGNLIDKRVPTQVGVLNALNFGVTGDGSTDDTSAINAFIATAAAANKVAYFPAATYYISSTLDFRYVSLAVLGDGKNETIFEMHASNTPLVMIGYEYQNISNVQFIYASQQTSADTASMGIQFWDPSFSNFDNIVVADAAIGIGLYQGDVTDPLNPDSMGNFQFALSVNNIFINGFTISGIDETAYPAGQGTSGSIWNNIYVQGGGQTITGYAVVFDAQIENWNLLTIGDFVSDTLGVVEVNGSNVTISGCAIGCDLETWGGALFIVYDNCTLDIEGLIVQDSTFSNNGDDTKAIFNVGDNAQVIANNIHLLNANTIDATTFVLMQSLDQTGKFWCQGIDAYSLSLFTALTAGDTVPPVCKQVNEQLFTYQTSAGNNVIWGTAAPSSGTWSQGDTCFNSDPTSTGPMAWVCTTAGTPGTWTAMGAPTVDVPNSIQSAMVTTTQTATSTATVAITALSVPLLADTNYAFEANLDAANSASGSTGVSIGVAVPAGATLQYDVLGVVGTASTATKVVNFVTTNTQEGGFITTSALTGFINIAGAIQMGTTTGSLHIGFASQTGTSSTAHGTATMEIGSNIIVTQI